MNELHMLVLKQKRHNNISSREKKKNVFHKSFRIIVSDFSIVRITDRKQTVYFGQLRLKQPLIQKTLVWPLFEIATKHIKWTIKLFFQFDFV